MKVVKSTKEIMGVEPSIGSEWDAGYIPAACLHRASRVTVHKDAEKLWSVYCIGRKGNIVLAQWSIAEFDCETCAKAFALCLVFGSDYAQCAEHGQDAFDEGDFLHGTARILMSVMGINPEDGALLDEGSHHRILWTAREILDGQKDWGKVIAAWEGAEVNRLPLNAAIRQWQAILTFGR